MAKNKNKRQKNRKKNDINFTEEKLNEIEELEGVAKTKLQIELSMKESRKLEKKIKKSEEMLYKETAYMMVGKRQEELNGLKERKEEFDNMTKAALIEAKKEVLQEIEKANARIQEVSTNASKSLAKIEEQRRNYNITEGNVFEKERAEVLEKAEKRIKEKFEAEMNVAKNELAELSKWDKMIGTYALELNIESEVENVKRPGIEEPVEEEPVVFEPVVEEPVVEEPVAEEEPVEEELAEEEPVEEELAEEEPGVEEIIKSEVQALYIDMLKDIKHALLSGSVHLNLDNKKYIVHNKNVDWSKDKNLKKVQVKLSELLLGNSILDENLNIIANIDQIDKILKENGIEQGEPVQGEPVQGEPVQGEPVQGEPVQGEPAQGEPVQGELEEQVEEEPEEPENQIDYNDLVERIYPYALERIVDRNENFILLKTTIISYCNNKKIDITFNERTKLASLFKEKMQKEGIINEGCDVIKKKEEIIEILKGMGIDKSIGRPAQGEPVQEEPEEPLQEELEEEPGKEPEEPEEEPVVEEPVDEEKYESKAQEIYKDALKFIKEECLKIGSKYFPAYKFLYETNLINDITFDESKKLEECLINLLKDKGILNKENGKNIIVTIDDIDQLLKQMSPEEERINSVEPEPEESGEEPEEETEQGELEELPDDIQQKVDKKIYPKVLKYIKSRIKRNPKVDHITFNYDEILQIIKKYENVYEEGCFDQIISRLENDINDKTKSLWISFARSDKKFYIEDDINKSIDANQLNKVIKILKEQNKKKYPNVIVEKIKDIFRREKSQKLLKGMTPDNNKNKAFRDLLSKIDERLSQEDDRNTKYNMRATDPNERDPEGYLTDKTEGLSDTQRDEFITRIKNVRESYGTPKYEAPNAGKENDGNETQEELEK